ncbi:hypothetical protein CYMTET_39829 [Cymbomonas tetramitiformis]|uniref:Uncharacterized protein n=1 Tax=Cymbomonas tetramitiformis TaxID=36881 RepID=A0AAE0F4A1_9CHLO|nr:hypothetical protein CYMTET_39829 [Cymbomonas tetramitiformis]
MVYSVGTITEVLLHRLKAADGCMEFKKQFEALFAERLHEYYPKTRGRIAHMELSTPLTAAHFLNAPQGGSYGLEWTPEHFDAALHEAWFDPVTKCQGLYLTGLCTKC